MSSVVCLFLLLLSLHACHGRHLGFADKRGKNSLLSGKGVKTEKHEKSASSSNSSPSYPAGMQTKETLLGKHDETEMKERWSGRTSLRQKEAKVLWEDKEVILKEEAGGRKLGSTSEEAEERVSSDEDDDDVEDVNVMDYAKPHRKPPIHNK
ncbi:hypothetical protein NMG60_11030316 [Bertholletia excelsa]